MNKNTNANARAKPCTYISANTPKSSGRTELRGSRALIRGLSHLSHSCFWIESLNKECVFPWHQTWLTGGDLGPDHAECVQLAWGSGEPKGELCGLLNGSRQKYWKTYLESQGKLYFASRSVVFLDRIVDLSLSTNKQHNFFIPRFSSSCVLCHHKLKEQVCQFISFKENLMMLLAFLLRAVSCYQLKEFREFLQKNDVLTAFKTQGVGGSLAACQTLAAHRTPEEKETL